MIGLISLGLFFKSKSKSKYMTALQELIVLMAYMLAFLTIVVCVFFLFRRQLMEYLIMVERQERIEQIKKSNLTYGDESPEEVERMHKEVGLWK